MTANRLTLLKIQRPEDRISPEYRTALLALRTEARAVFPHVELVELAPGDVPPTCSDEPVLLVGPGAVLLGRHSLTTMVRHLESGADAVSPYHLGATALAAERPPFTRRGIEQIENLFLDESPPRAPVHGEHLPATLFSGTAWENSRATGADLLERPLAHEKLGLERVTHAGLCHPFIDYYGEVRQDILPFIPTSAASILEIGCARGATGRFLQEERGCRVTGVELNPEAARDASEVLHRVIAGDVLSVDLGGPYDAVIATELFEHLTDQHAFLQRVRQVLAPGGQLVLSVPNVGHWSIVDDLLAGRWDYLPIGLLCSTHYRFFTRTTLSEWLLAGGFGNVTIEPQMTELPERFRRLHEFETDLDSLATSGFWVVARVS